jgi:hypothetical protein
MKCTFKKKKMKKYYIKINCKSKISFYLILIQIFSTKALSTLVYLITRALITRNMTFLANTLIIVERNIA